MGRRTAGEELQDLFRGRDGDILSAAEFARRKALILRRSGCRLTVPVPGWPTRCARAVLAAIVRPWSMRSLAIRPRHILR